MVLADMSAQGGRAKTALIERVCDAHADRDPEGPLVTTVEGVWAFCAGCGAADHVWRTIEPVTRQHLEADLLTRDANALGPAAS
jgi:hypothetical protein